MPTSKKQSKANKALPILPYTGLILIGLNFSTFFVLFAVLPSTLISVIQRSSEGMAGYWWYMTITTIAEGVLALLTVALSIATLKGMRLKRRKAWKQMWLATMAYVLMAILLALPSAMAVPRNSAGYAAYTLELILYSFYIGVGLVFVYLLKQNKKHYTK